MGARLGRRRFHNHGTAAAARCASVSDSGLWEFFAPGLEAGVVYKYEVIARDGGAPALRPTIRLRRRNAPLDRLGRRRHRGLRMDGFRLHGAARAGDFRRKPMSVFEVHLGSWRRGEDGGFLHLRAARDTGPYAVEMGFTHLELLPVTEHPLDASWGYQPIACSRRRAGSATRRELRARRPCARAGLGVHLDWVPAHFPVDATGSRISTARRSTNMPTRRAASTRLDTAIYDFGRRESPLFPLGQRALWIDRFTSTACASTRRLDAYSTFEESGRMSPNADGGNANRDAIAFIKHANELSAAASRRVDDRRGIHRMGGRFVADERRRLGFHLQVEPWAGCTTRSNISARSDPSAMDHDKLTSGCSTPFTEKLRPADLA